MSRFKQKAVLRKHSEDKYEDLGVIVWVSKVHDRLWYVPYPMKQELAADKVSPRDFSEQSSLKKAKSKRSRTRHYIREPEWLTLSRVEDDAAWSSHPAKLPEIMGLSDDQLESQTPPPPQLNMRRRSRRKLGKSKAKRDKAWHLIKDLVKLPIHELLDPPCLKQHCDKRREDLATENPPTVLKDNQPIIRALRCYWLWGMNEQALMPRHDLSNEIGKAKHHKVRPGRDSSKFPVGIAGVIATEFVRSQLRRGWKKYKTSKRISVQKAYYLTMVEFYGDDGKGGHLYPAHERPTLEQFKLHGPGPDASAARINMGKNKYLRGARPLRGSSRDGIVAVGQVVFTDSSGVKQHLVSSRSRLDGLSTCYETLVVEGSTGYISGHHSGFEHPSNMTGLMALGNSASDKADYLRYYGFEPEQVEWLGVTFGRVRADNGELKNEKGIQTMSVAGACAEFVRSYAAELKGPVETKHHSMNRISSQLMAGGHDGKPSERGDVDPRRDACMNHYEHVQARIRAILFHNNNELVPELLTDEERDAKVKPTRAEILKYRIREGYVKTESPDMELLRAQCLPRLKASIFRRWIEIWDPTSPKQKRYIGNLKYSVASLEASGVLANLGEKHKDCEVLINPNQLSKIWVNNGRWYECKILSNDPLVHERTLLDHLRNCQDDRDTEANLHNETENAAAQNVAKQHQASEEAKKQKRTEKAAASKKAGEGSGAPKSAKRGIRQATDDERAQQKRERLGLGTEEDSPDAEGQPMGANEEPQMKGEAPVRSSDGQEPKSSESKTEQPTIGGPSVRARGRSPRNLSAFKFQTKQLLKSYARS